MDNYCNGFIELQEQGKEVFVKHPTYGWVLSWMELTEEKGYTQVHRYSRSISFCPMCGKKLLNNV